MALSSRTISSTDLPPSFPGCPDLHLTVYRLFLISQSLKDQPYSTSITHSEEDCHTGIEAWKGFFPLKQWVFMLIMSYLRLVVTEEEDGKDTDVKRV
jgi:hypothetical protein